MRKNVLLSLVLLCLLGCDDEDVKPSDPPPPMVNYVKSIKWRRPSSVPGPHGKPFDLLYSESGVSGNEGLIAFGHNFDIQLYDGQPLHQEDAVVEFLVGTDDTQCSPETRNLWSCSNGASPTPGLGMADDKSCLGPGIQNWLCFRRKTNRFGAVTLKLNIDRRLPKGKGMAPRFTRYNDVRVFAAVRVRVSMHGELADQYVYGGVYWVIPMFANCNDLVTCQIHQDITPAASREYWQRWESRPKSSPGGRPVAQAVSESEIPWVCGDECADPQDQDADGIYDCHDVCPADSNRWYTVGPCGCGGPVPCTLPPDLDADGDVDLDDFGAMQRCLHSSASGDCLIANLNVEFDNEVDELDLDILRRCSSGAHVPYDPSCLP